MADLTQLQPAPFSAPEDFLAGRLLLVDKPKGWTSFDVVNKVRFALKHKLGVKKIKVGHSGTLDPMATGLLLICTGKATKALAQLQGLDKVYSGEITLGATTPTYDAESAPENERPTEDISDEQIIEASKKFHGEMDQVPPIYSAIKKDGVAAYTLARRGKEVKLEPRRVQIHAFNILEVDIPRVRFRVHCSKGFYVRSLAHDIGDAIGSGGYLSMLRRESVGSFHVGNAWTIDQLILAIRQLPDPAARV